jgi:hypothetical protein
MSRGSAVEPIGTGAGGNLLNLSQLCQKRKIAVNRPKADIRKFVLYILVYRFRGRMIETPCQALLDTFPLPAVSNHKQSLLNNNENYY